MKRILTWQEAENLSGLTERQLKKAVADGKLKAYWKNSKEYGVTEDTLEEYRNTTIVLPAQLRKGGI